MAAPTNTYCNYATGTGHGNDYKGATFTDGAYTSATKTLVKAGAFAASKVNHWLYLESNDGGSIVAGFYKIATATDANTVVLATDAGAGVDDDAAKCVQHDGTTTLPWRSIQGALDLITRDATNGDKINVKAGTAQVNAAALVTTTYGVAAAATPLIIRGYTTSANDGGIGEIDCGGFSFWGTAYTYFILADLQIHTFGDNAGVAATTNGQGRIYHCNIHKGASTPTSKTLVHVGNGAILYSYVHDAGTTGVGVSSDGSGCVLYCYVYNCPTGLSVFASINNIIVDSTVYGISPGSFGITLGNTVYSSTASTGTGIRNGTLGSVLNNIIEGYSGAGGKGISDVSSSNNTVFLGYNAFFNNTTPESLAGDIWFDLGNDATLAASPFTAPSNAVTADFSLLTSVAGAIDGAFAGFYGLTGTTDHADIGAVQAGAGAAAGISMPRVRIGH